MEKQKKYSHAKYRVGKAELNTALLQVYQLPLTAAPFSSYFVHI